jgi:hypothetical protein
MNIEVLPRWLFSPKDARVYALVRVALGFVTLTNVASLWPYRRELFSGGGILGAAAVRESIPGQNMPAFLVDVIGDDRGAPVLIVAGLVGVALMLGLSARVAAILAYGWQLVCWMRLHQAMTGWDDLIRNYSFLVMLAPLGGIWSFDRRLRGPRPNDASAPAYGLYLMRLQLCVIYLQTAWMKIADPTWRRGTLVPILTVSQFARFDDHLFLVDHPGLGALMTWSALALECWLPFFLFVPRTRRACIAVGLGFHAFLGVTSKVLPFSLAMLVPYAAFLESEDVDLLVAWARRVVPSSRSLPGASGPA